MVVREISMVKDMNDKDLTRTLSGYVRTARKYPNLFLCMRKSAKRLCEEINEEERKHGEQETDWEKISDELLKAVEPILNQQNEES